jgi:succinate dehydrogenase/fumarate reductase cytochrome b subunit
LNELIKSLADLEKAVTNASKDVGPLLLTIVAVIWMLVLYIYFRGIRAYLREKGKEMSIDEIDRLDDLVFIKSRTDEEKKEFKALKAKKKEMKKESTLSYYLTGFILLFLATLMLVKIDWVILWLKQF